MEWLSLASHYPLIIIPFATSIALVIGSPDAEPARPRALVGGHVVATLVGLAMVKLTAPSAWAAAMAVGLAILTMYLTGTFHPPAGIDPLLVVSNSLPWSFLLAPDLAGALLLTVFAYLWHRWLRRRRGRSVGCNAGQDRVTSLLGSCSANRSSLGPTSPCTVGSPQACRDGRSRRR